MRPVTTHLAQKRGLWYAVWYAKDRNPPRVWRSLKTKKASVARRRLTNLETEFSLGQYDPWRDARNFDALTVEAALRLHEKAHKGHADRTKEQRRGILTALGHAGDVRSVRTSDIERFLVQHTPATASTYRNQINSFFNWAVTAGIVKDNPCPPPIKFERREREALRPIEIDRWARAASPHVGNVIILMAATGLRIGECHSLTPDDIQPDRIMVGRSFRTKTMEGRTVPLFPRARHAVAALPWPLPYKTKDSLRVLIARAARTAFPGRRLSAHYLRHTFISWCVNDLNIPVPVAAQMAGHKHLTTTMGYVHVTPDDIMGAVARVQGMSADAPVSPVAVWLSTHSLQVSAQRGAERHSLTHSKRR